MCSISSLLYHTMNPSVNCLKKRRRTKELVKNIKEQVEFYFSDANLNRDKFMKELVGCNGAEYVSLDILLKFNQLQHMETNVGLLQKALKSSVHLLLSNDMKAVKRKANCIKPLPSDVDHCTVVIECLPPNASVQWLKAVCTKFGPVSYISLPRFKCDSIKGFAFIEYTKSEDATLACSVLNSPPPNFFPKMQHFSFHLKTNLSQKPQNENCVTKLFKYNAKNPRLCKYIAEKVENHNNCTCISSVPASIPVCKYNTCNTSVSNMLCKYDDRLSNICVEAEGNVLLSKSSINRLNCSSANHIEKQDDLHSAKQALETSLGYCKFKRLATVPLDLYHTEEQYSTKKAKGSESLDAVDQSTKAGILNCFKNAHKKRRKRKHREKSQKGKVNKESNKKISLHAIMKTDWVEIKKSYVHEQRENFGKLKSILQKCSGPDPETASVYIKHHLALKKSATENYLEMSDPEIEDQEMFPKKTDKPLTSSSMFIPGVVVSLSSLPINNQSDALPPLPHFTSIKSYFEQYGRVAYVDVKLGAAYGYVRFETSEAAQCAIMEEKQYSLVLLTSAQEERYWDKLLVARQLRRTREREKIRGKQRLIFRAEKRTDIASTRHIRFNANYH